MREDEIAFGIAGRSSAFDQRDSFGRTAGATESYSLSKQAHPAEISRGSSEETIAAIAAKLHPRVFDRSSSITVRGSPSNEKAGFGTAGRAGGNCTVTTAPLLDWDVQRQAEIGNARMIKMTRPRRPALHMELA